MEWTAGICLLAMLAFAAIVVAVGRHRSVEPGDLAGANAGTRA
jgi:hypothetical protein